MEVDNLDISENCDTTSLWACSLLLPPVEDQLKLQKEKIGLETETWGTPTFKGQAEKENMNHKSIEETQREGAKKSQNLKKNSVVNSTSCCK